MEFNSARDNCFQTDVFLLRIKAATPAADATATVAIAA
jgi:hypothetical protein